MAKVAKLKVWDLPVRLFHWALAVLLAVSYFSGRTGGEWMELHFWSGYAILALIIFRIIWGFIGSTTARFANFVKGPGAVLMHIREFVTARPHAIGHNALGGIMVIILLGAVLLQVAAGLFAADTDMGTVNGPLANLVADSWVDRATALHKYWVNVLLALVGLHVLAVLLYLLWKRQDLVGPMLTGRKRLDDAVPPGKPAPTLVFAPGRLAFAVLVVAAAVVYFIVRLGG